MVTAMWNSRWMRDYVREDYYAIKNMASRNDHQRNEAGESAACARESYAQHGLSGSNLRAGRVGIQSAAPSKVNGCKASLLATTHLGHP